MSKLIVEVVEVRGNCTLGFQMSDRIIWEEPASPNTGTSGHLCPHAYQAINLATGMLDQFKEVYVACPDPGPPYNTTGGTVFFKVHREV